MPAHVPIDAETVEKLRRLAEAQNVSVAEFLAAHVPGLASQSDNGSEPANMVEAFEEWVGDFPSDRPVLSDDAVGREAIYRDR